MKHSILVIFIIFSFSSSFLFAQTKLPNWVNANPTSTMAVGYGRTQEDAKFLAISSILSNVNFAVQEGSFLSALQAKGLSCPGPLSAVSKQIVRDGSFSLLNEYENEDGYWVQCKLQNVQETLETLYQEAVIEGTRCLQEANIYQEEGLLF